MGLEKEIVSALETICVDLKRTLQRFKLRKLKVPTQHSFAKLSIKRLPELSTHFEHKRKLVIHARLPEIALRLRNVYEHVSTGRNPYDPADPAVDYHTLITSQIPVTPQGTYVYVPDVDAIVEAFWFMHELVQEYCANGGRDIWLGGSNQVTDYTFRGYWAHLLNSRGGGDAAVGLQHFNNEFYLYAVRLTNLKVDLAASDAWILDFLTETLDALTEDLPGYKIERALRGF